MYIAEGFSTSSYDARKQTFACKDLRRIRQWILAFLSVPGRKVVLYSREPTYNWKRFSGLGPAHLRKVMTLTGPGDMPNW